MYKKMLFGIVICALMTILLAACTIRDNTGPVGPAVHMGGANFIQTTATLKKGDKLTLIDDAAVPHIVVNGSWQGSAQVPKKEPGAPTVNLNFKGNDAYPTPPFNTAGTFHIYCTIHGGMNLVITVQ